jgi:succinoglycan biosynthesis transport protein ExoP
MIPAAPREVARRGRRYAVLELWRYYRILCRRKWIVLAGVAVCMLAAAGLVFFTPATLESVSYVRQVTPQTLGSTVLQEMQSVRPELVQASVARHAASNVFRAYYIGLLSNNEEYTRRVREALDREAAQGAALAEDVVAIKDFLERRAARPYIFDRNQIEKLLNDYTTVLPERESDLIRIIVKVPDNFVGADPSRDGPEFAQAAAFAAAIAFKYSYKAKNYDPSEVRAYLERKVREARADLEAKRAALENYKKSRGISDLNAAAQVRLARLGDLDFQLRASQVQAREAAQRVRAAQNELRALPLTREEQKTTGDNTLWTTLATELARREQELASMLTYRGENHPEVQALRKSIEELKSSQAQEQRQRIVQRVEAINPVHTQTLDRFVQAKVDSIAAEARTSALAAVLPQMKSELNSFPEEEREVALRTVEVQTAEQTFALLKNKLEEARIRENEPYRAGDISIVGVIDPKPATSRKLQLALALPLSLLLAFAVVLLLDYIDTTVRTPDQVEDLLGLPVVTMVPLSKGPSLVKGLPSPGLRECYEMLTAELWHLASQEAGKGAILVAGAAPRAGRSTTASNLAIALAGDGARVILVDADLRNPTQHVLFGVDNSRGLANVLSGGAALEDVAVPTRVEGLLLVPSGPLPDNPIRLLRGEAMERFVADASAVADFVVFDSPAGAAFADATVLAAVIKRTLLVQSAGVPPTGAEAEFRMRLDQVGAEYLGVLFNRVRPEEVRGPLGGRSIYRSLPPSPPAAGTVSPTSPAIPG